MHAHVIAKIHKTYSVCRNRPSKDLSHCLVELRMLIADGISILPLPLILECVCVTSKRDPITLRHTHFVCSHRPLHDNKTLLNQAVVQWLIVSRIPTRPDATRTRVEHV